MFFICWGTKVRERPKGAIAFNCPHCGEITIADCTSVQTAGHVYFISGSYKEKTDYLQCRLCGMFNRPPPQVTVSEPPSEREALPTPEFTRSTDPRLEGARPIPIPYEDQLPATVSRCQFALMNGVLGVFQKKGENDGAMKAVLVLGMIGLIIAITAVWVNYSLKHKQVWTGLILTATVAFIIFFIRLQRAIVWRAVDRSFAKHLWRYLAHTDDTLGGLSTAADALGPGYTDVRRFFERVRQRTGAA